MENNFRVRLRNDTKRESGIFLVGWVGTNTRKTVYMEAGKSKISPEEVTSSPVGSLQRAQIANGGWACCNI